MPRYNVHDEKTGKWRCFSTVSDDWVTDWMDEERFNQWRRLEYGRTCGDLKDTNRMTIEEAEEAIEMRKIAEEVIEIWKVNKGEQ